MIKPWGGGRFLSHGNKDADNVAHQVGKMAVEAL